MPLKRQHAVFYFHRDMPVEVKSIVFDTNLEYTIQGLLNDAYLVIMQNDHRAKDWYNPNRFITDVATQMKEVVSITSIYTMPFPY